MSRYIHLFFCAAAILALEVSAEETFEQRLRTHLMYEYDRSSLPTTNTTRVAMRFTVRHVNMIESEDIMELDAWITMLWQDPRLTWRESIHVPKMSFRQDQIWHPDISLFNNAAAIKTEDLSSIRLMVYPDGEVLFVYSTLMKVPCVADLTMWPYDVHNCSAKFASWIHDGYQIELDLYDDKAEVEVDLAKSYQDERNLTRGQWGVLASSLQKSTTYYYKHTEPYPHITLRLLVQRNAPAYFYTVQLPLLMLTVLTAVVFLLPPGAIEKVLVGALILFLNMQFLTYITTTIPHSPSHTPLIVVLVSQQFVLTAIIVFISALVVRLVKDPHQSSLPRCCQRGLAVMAVICCLGNYRKVASKSEMSPYPQGLKGEDLELGDNFIGRSYPNGTHTVPGTPSSGNNNTSSSGGSSRRAPYDYLLLGAILDRGCLVIYLLVIVSNLVTFRSVIFS